MSRSPGRDREPIAIVGIGCRFPGADGPAAFWRLLRDGVDAIGDLPPGRWDLETWYDPRPDIPGTTYTRRGGFLDDVDMFDAAFFGLSPREAEAVDPQQRLLLEAAHSALEDAGCNIAELAGTRTGVFVGMCYNDYEDMMFADPETLDLYATMGGSRFSAAGRISFCLGFQGPSMLVDTACSSAVVAAHLACRSLRDGECTTALAGGVNLILQPHVNVCLSQGHVLAPDGRCKFGDASADGYSRSEGVGVVVLKTLSRALADGNPIYALIRGSAVGHKGAGGGGMVTPDGAALQSVARAAYRDAGVAPGDVQYLEAHGTGTQRGDATELPAIGAVVAEGRTPGDRCLVGSVKSNIGHGESASGAASIIKIALSLHHEIVPPSLHCTTPNPAIPWEELPVTIPRECMPWPECTGPARAACNSFGISGTSAHMVLEAAPPSDARRDDPARPGRLLTFSAKTPTALDGLCVDLADELERHPNKSLTDVAFTLQVGRCGYDYRRTLVVSSREDAIEALRSRDSRRVRDGVRPQTQAPLVFMFSGLGDHYPQMARGLYDSEPVFRKTLDCCCALLEPIMGMDLRDALYPGPAPGPGNAGQGIDLRAMLGRTRDTAPGPLARTAIAQPALFVVEYALAQLWMDLGVRPQALIGHSLGEYVAACLAGVFSLPASLRLVAERGRIIEELPGGSMLGVNLSEAEIRPHLDGEMSLAAVNAPSLCVVSGPTEAVERLQEHLQDQGAVCQRLAVSHAFHSTMMKPVADRLADLVEGFERREPEIPFVSNLTGRWITAQEATDPRYWARHLCEPVRFADGVGLVLEDPTSAALEVGPGHTLLSFARQHPAFGKSASRAAMVSLRHCFEREDDRHVLLESTGALWRAGNAIEWPRLYTGEEPRLEHLPTYPFERDRYWIRTPDSPPKRTGKQAIADWFHGVSWKRSVTPAPAPAAGSWLIFADGSIGPLLGERLATRGEQVITVQCGTGFERLGTGQYAIDPSSRSNYQELLAEIEGPLRIAHLWSLERGEDLGFFSLVQLAQALGERDESGPVRLGVITASIHDVTGTERLRPEQATVLGACRVIPQEHPAIGCVSIDLEHTECNAASLDRLIAEIASDAKDPVVAHRGTHRWVQTFERVVLDEPDASALPLRTQGTYLITGGLGGLGFATAEFLARAARARLVLMGRTGLGDDDGRRAKRVRDLETLGAEVLVVEADVADPGRLSQAIARAQERFGPIHGVVHAAGVPGSGLIQVKDREQVKAVFAPKVLGARALHETLRENELDFVVFYSSITAIVGGIGQVDYCAANAFLDAYAHDLARHGTTRVVSIDWGPWQWDDWQSSLASPVPEVQEMLARVRREFGISFAEGRAAFARILACPLPQVIVTPQDLDEVIEQHVGGLPGGLGELVGAEGHQRERHPRPTLRTSYAAPATDTECCIAEMWQELLGLERVGANDNFFELGGHSLLGMRLLARIQATHGVTVPMRGLFESPTVHGIAGLVEEMILSEIEQTDEAEAERMLQERAAARDVS